MTLFYANDMSSKVDEWEYFFNKSNDYITDEEIWDLARCSENPPHLGNLYTSILLNRIMYILNEKYNVPMDNMDIEINSICSNLYVDQEQVDTLEDFDTIIERYSEQD